MMITNCYFADVLEHRSHGFIFLVRSSLYCDTVRYVVEKGSSYSIAERRVPELITVLGTACR